MLVDNMDPQLEEYKRLYGDIVIVFDKREKAKTCDTMDTFGKMNIVLYARNSCHDIARSLGLKYFFELDDDYKSFDIRYPDEKKLKAKKITDIETLLNAMIEFMERSDAMVVCFSQGGDYLGGVNRKYYWRGLARKAMNAYICDVDKPFSFIGTINEDTNMYVTLNMVGKRIFSVTNLSVIQLETQANPGGLTDIYLDIGTYVKSFYSVMAQPSCVYVKDMGSSHRRIHHMVKWQNCAPMILNPRWKKT